MKAVVVVCGVIGSIFGVAWLHENATDAYFVAGFVSAILVGVFGIASLASSH